MHTDICLDANDSQATSTQIRSAPDGVTPPPTQGLPCFQLLPPSLPQPAQIRMIVND